jgi:hypothetical protein
MRRFLQDLTLLAAVSAAGGYALARVDPPTTQAPALALEPIVLDRATPAAPDEAMNLLRTATIFSSAAVGFAGVVPDNVVAWRTVLSQPMAHTLFLDLLHTATPAGQAYALAGLRAISPASFHLWAQPFFNSEMVISTMVGCIISPMTTGAIVDQLQRGMWIGDFVTASRSRYFGELPWPED